MVFTIMVNTYICTTPYHLLISIIKVLLNKEEGKHDLILDQLTNFSSETLENVNYSNLFKSVFLLSPVFDYSQKGSKILHKLGFVPNTLFKKSPLKKDYFENKNIYIFHDLTYFGQFLNSFKIPYNLIEDGCNLFKITIPFQRKIPFWGLYCKIRGLYPLGQSPLIKTIEVNDIQGILLKRPNIIETSRALMFKQLCSTQVDVLCTIFGIQRGAIQIQENSTLLLTQPLNEDGLMSHDEKISLLKHLICKHGTEHLYIKPHPREKEDYKIIFPNATIWDYEKVPIELLCLLNEFSFEKVITPFSTAIFSVINAKEKFFFGYKETLSFAKRA